MPFGDGSVAIRILHPELEGDLIDSETCLHILDVLVGQLLVGRERIASVEESQFPLDDAVVGGSLDAVVQSATEVSLTNFLGGSPEFADEFLLGWVHSGQMLNLEGFQRVELLELVGREF